MRQYTSESKIQVKRSNVSLPPIKKKDENYNCPTFAKAKGQMGNNSQGHKDILGSSGDLPVVWN